MWDTNFSRIAYSTDGGATWNSTDGPTWENPGAETSTGNHPFQMVAFGKRDGYVYMFGTPNGRFGAAHVARVVETSILDKTAYEYWTGAAWETGAVAELAAAEIVPPNVAELSVIYNEHAGKWLMTYLDENLDIVLRSADSPEGPWSASQAISTFADHPGLYGGFLHPSSTGEDLYLAMTQWDPYNVSLVRASIDEDAEPDPPEPRAGPELRAHHHDRPQRVVGMPRAVRRRQQPRVGHDGQPQRLAALQLRLARPVPDHHRRAEHRVRAADVAAHRRRDRCGLLRCARGG